MSPGGSRRRHYGRRAKCQCPSRPPGPRDLIGRQSGRRHRGTPAGSVTRARHPAGIRRGQIQAIVDELRPRLSGSRVRSTVNAFRSLYRRAGPKARRARPRRLGESPRDKYDRARACCVTDRVRRAGRSAPARHHGALCTDGIRDGRRAQIIRPQWSEVGLEVAALEWGTE